MILRAAKFATRPLHFGWSGKSASMASGTPVVPYDMFDRERTQREAQAARQMERIYHKGQEKIWDGRVVLQELLDKHDGIQIDPRLQQPLRRVLSVIFWGELAAWKVSAELALHLEPLEAIMAATAQTHDEARHFYVMHDYLQLLGYEPSELPAGPRKVIENILNADSLAKKLLGMQLMVEPVAMSMFQLVRELEIEPVLSELVVLYERDEARHVSLGVQFLPELIAKMNRRERIDLHAWQLKLFLNELEGVREMQADFKALGLQPREVVRLGQLKQYHACRLLEAQSPSGFPVEEIFNRLIEMQLAWSFPTGDTSIPSRLKEAGTALFGNPEELRRFKQQVNATAPEKTFSQHEAA